MGVKQNQTSLPKARLTLTTPCLCHSKVGKPWRTTEKTHQTIFALFVFFSVVAAKNDSLPLCKFADVAEIVWMMVIPNIKTDCHTQCPVGDGKRWVLVGLHTSGWWWCRCVWSLGLSNWLVVWSSSSAFWRWRWARLCVVRLNMVQPIWRRCTADCAASSVLSVKTVVDQARRVLSVMALDTDKRLSHVA